MFGNKNNNMKILILFFSFFSLPLFAQQTLTLDSIESRINKLAIILHSDTILFKRDSAAKEIEKLFSENLIRKESYSYPFTKIKGVSVLQPADKKFKIFTWELFIDDNHYKQFGIIQTSEEKVFVLNDKSEEIKQAEFSKLKYDNWYGALYYHIQPFAVSKTETQYLLLGRDSYNFFERRKVVEILYFDPAGKPRFGNSLIQVKDGFGKMRNVCRFFLQYSVAASVLLRYDNEHKMIIFDHLVRGASLLEGGPPVNFPDGSFNGLKCEKGRWEFVDMVFKYDSANILEDATNPSEIIKRNTKRKSDKDIFGKDLNSKDPKKNNK
jgi:hypothetical protein